VARRTRPSPAASWRDGVHITGTPIWCDARRRRDVCFVSSADRVGRAEHGQLVATPLTLALLGAATGHLGVPLRRPFTLGTLRLELLPSGRTLGAAALHVLGARSVLYAGSVRTIGSSEPAEVRECDAVIVGAAVDRSLRPLDEVAGELATWVRARLAANQRPVVIVDCASDGLEVAARLATAKLPVAGSRAVREAAARVADIAPVPSLRAPAKSPHVLVQVAHEQVRVPQKPRALVSVRAIEPAPGFDARFAWPFTADKKQLLAWIEHTNARNVYVTGPKAEAIASVLGDRAKVLGPPHQMSLFEA
jgi:putative mRNA 3-end processing factor